MSRARRMRIGYLSGTRADYELMRPVLRAIREDPALSVEVLVTGMHLRREYGRTVDEIESDGFRIAARIDTLQRGDSTLEMTKTLGRTIVGLAGALERRRPDLLLLLGDRDEQLAAALAGGHMNIPLAQVHAGERSGSIDECNRHAITRFAHLHLAACRDSRDRLIRMGEEPFRVRLIGAPGIDAISRMRLLGREELSAAVGADLARGPYLVLLQHSVTTEESQAGRQIRESLAAIARSGLLCVALAPNADAGGKAIDAELRAAEKRGALRRVVHLRHLEYASLLKEAAALVGNSSSGIIEAPYLAVPAVNVGSRQALRFRGSNVLDVPHDRRAILRALERAASSEFRRALSKDRFIYGRGKAAAAAIRAIKSFPWREKAALEKRLSY